MDSSPLRRRESPRPPAGASETELPELRGLVGVCREYFKGGLTREQTLGQLDAVDDLMGRMFVGFREELRFQEESPLLLEVTPIVFDAFDELWEIMLGARRSVYAGERDACMEALQDARARITTVLEAFARLHQEAASRERYSDSPLVDELCRVGYACLRGTLARELLQERLVGFLETHHRFVSALPADLPAALQLACERQTSALHEVESFLQEGDEARLEHALAELCYATEQMLRERDWLTAGQEEAAVRHCPRCSASNSALARHCMYCQAPFPQVIEAVQPAMLDMRVGQAQAESTVVSANLLELQEAAARVQAGHMPLPDFQDMLTEFNERVAMAAERMMRALPPPPDTAPRQAEAFHLAQQKMRAGLASMQEGLTELWSWTESRQPGTLEHGLELIGASGDQLIAAQHGVRTVMAALQIPD